MTDAPTRSPAQRMEALGRANAVRSFRARLKRRIKDHGKEAGKVEVAWQLVDPHPLLTTMKIRGLLIACPGIGSTKADRILRECRISPSRTIGGLTARQRLELACKLPPVFPDDLRLIRELETT